MGFVMYTMKEGDIVLLKSCNRCGNLIPYGTTYCDTCRSVVATEREEHIHASKLKSNKQYNKTRNPKYVRFYNSVEWRTLSAKYAQDKGYRCEKCGAIAAEVHHVKAIQTEEGWEHRLDPDNLELLCKGCHNERHERFRKKQKYIKHT